MGNDRKSIKVPAEVYAQLEILKRRYGRSYGDVIRMLIVKYGEELDPKVVVNKALDEFVEAVKPFGVALVAENMRPILVRTLNMSEEETSELVEVLMDAFVRWLRERNKNGERGDVFSGNSLV